MLTLLFLKRLKNKQIKNRIMNRKKNFKFVLKFFISLLFVFAFQQPVKAQFFKKLAQKAEEKIKREAERRSERRVDRTIDKGFDKTEDQIDSVGKKKKRNSKKEKNNSSQENNRSQNQKNEQSKNANSTVFKDFGGSNEKIDLPDKLNFKWKYVLKMESKSIKKEYGSDSDIKIIYRINPNQSLFASKIYMESNPVQNMIMIMDPNNNLNVMLFNMNGMKMIKNMPIPKDNSNKGVHENKYTITKIDKKEILGFTCQGYLVKSKDGVAKIYFTKNAPVHFSGFFASANKPKGISPKMFKEMEGGLMMYMEYIDNKRKKNNLTMSCIELKKEPFTINLNEYKN